MGRATRQARARRAGRGLDVRALAPVARRAGAGSVAGAAAGLVCLAVGLGGAALATAAGQRVTWSGFGAGALLYVLGFAAAGAAVGALWPARRRPGGRYALAVLGAVIVFAFIARATAGPLATWGRAEYVQVVALGLAFGAVLGHRAGRP